MDDEIYDLAWRAFSLGSRVTLAARGDEIGSNELSRIVGYLYPIASKDSTLHDPTANALGRDAPTATCVIRIGNKSILADRQLAVQVLHGFETATDVTDNE
jgi:hypothetical protein